MLPKKKPTLQPMLNTNLSTSLPHHPATARCPPRNLLEHEASDVKNRTAATDTLVHSPSTQHFSPINPSLVGAAFSKYYVGYGDCLGTIVRYDKDTQQYIGQFVHGRSEVSFSPEEVQQYLSAPSTTSPTAATSVDSVPTAVLNVDVPLFLDAASSATSTKPPTPVNHTNDNNGSHSPSTPDTNACVPPSRPVDILPSHVMSPKSKSSSAKKKKKTLYTTQQATHAAPHAAPPKPQTLTSFPAPEAIKKGPWTEAEDATVLEGVRRLQLEGHTGKLMKHIKWSDLALSVPGRSGKQVRERWYNHLDPTVNKGPWTAAEMLVLHDVHARLGNQWSKISDHLPGRTQNHIKNRWNSIKRKSDRVTGADGRKSRAYRKRWKSGGGGRAEDEARQRSYSNVGESAAARYGGNPRKRSMSTNDVGDSLDEFFASNSPRSRKRTRTSASLSSSLSSSASFSSSSSRPCSPTFGFGTSVDLQTLSISMQGWMLQPANNEGEGDQDGPEERDHPLMRYLERCPTSCELDELTNVSNYLKDESTRMQHMMEWLAKDIENENVQQPQQAPHTPPAPPQTQPPPQPSPTNPKKELWRPESLVSAFPLELPITANHIDWWERSMATPTSDDHVARGDRNQGVSLSSMMVGVGHIMGAGLLNKTVQIEWGEEDKKWYGGRCVEWVAPQHKIQYDNGEVEWVSLYREFDNGVVWRLAPV